MSEAGSGAALVTGACGGIGAALVAALAADNISTVALDIVPAPAADVSIIGDVTVEDDVERAVTAARDRFGSISFLLCAAGVTSRSPIADLPLAEWYRVVDVSLTGTFLAVRAVMGEMATAGFGRIVAIASGHGVKGCRFGAHDAAAKAGVIALIKSATLELGDAGVTANVVAPGPVATPMLASVGGPSPGVADAIPLGRVGEPDDVVAATRFLLSAGASYITGQTVHVNGGLLMP